MPRFWTLCLLVLSIFSVSCLSGPQYWTYHLGTPPSHIAHPTRIPIYLDSSFTPQQMEEIRAAAAEWNMVFQGQIVLQIVSKQALGLDKKMHSYPDTFQGWEAGQTLLKKCEKGGNGWVVFNLPSTSKHLESFGVNDRVLAFVAGVDEHFIVIVSDRMATRSWKDITMHEMAHLLGARHVNAPSLENPTYSYNQYDCIDKITVAQVAEVQHLDFNTLSYCVTPHFE
jgi:urease accessory protein UreE